MKHCAEFISNLAENFVRCFTNKYIFIGSYCVKARKEIGDRGYVGFRIHVAEVEATSRKHDKLLAAEMGFRRRPARRSQSRFADSYTKNIV